MNDETLDKAVWHILAQQMTHIINCEDPKHRKAMSCVAFTAGAHVELMQLIKQDREKAVREARIDELEIITDHYTPYRPFLDDDKNVNIRRYCTDRLAELSNPTQEKD